MFLVLFSKYLAIPKVSIDTGLRFHVSADLLAEFIVAATLDLHIYPKLVELSEKFGDTHARRSIDKQSV